MVACSNILRKIYCWIRRNFQWISICSVFHLSIFQREREWIMRRLKFMLRNAWNYNMKKVILEKCSCSYFKKEDVSGRTPSSVANDTVDKTKRWSLRTSLLTQPRAMELMHLTTIAGAPCPYFFSWKNMPNA